MAAFEPVAPTCPRCGSVGIHGCIGRRLPAPTAEDERRVGEALHKAFGAFGRDDRLEAPQDVLGGLR